MPTLTQIKLEEVNQVEQETLVWLFGQSYTKEQATIEAEEKEKQNRECYND